jgi:hypothetical protein
MVKYPSNYVEEEDEIPNNDNPINRLDIEEGQKPHVRITTYKEIKDDETTIYVQVFGHPGDLKAKKEVESPTIEDAIKTADNYSKTYDIPVLLDNINLN